MYTNADVTLYQYSKEGKTEKYTRRVIRRVYWEDAEQSTFLKTGQRNACSALLVIPLCSVENPLHIMKGSDLVVKGICEAEIDCSSPAAISQSLESMKKNHGALTVTSVDQRLYGSASVQHYELSCK